VTTRGLSGAFGARIRVRKVRGRFLALAAHHRGPGAGL